MTQKKEFACIASGQTTEVSLLVLTDNHITARYHTLNGMREAMEVAKEIFSHDLMVGECYPNYESWHRAHKERLQKEEEAA